MSDEAQAQPDIQTTTWILWFAFLMSIFTQVIVLFTLKTNSTNITQMDTETLLAIYAGVALILMFLSKSFNQKARAIINRNVTDNNAKKTLISKAFVSYLISWAIGTELIAILGLTLRFIGGADFIQYSYGFLAAAIVIHITNRPAFSFKS